MTPSSLRRFSLPSRFVQRRLRKLVLFAIVINLLLWPGPSLFARDFLAAASQAVNSPAGLFSYQARFLRWLFYSRPAVRRHETMADRARAVARLRINPGKLVGYENERASFNALPVDFLDRTVQGVKLSWESSNTGKLEIDDAGNARFLQPGLAWVTCRAGGAVGTVPVLIRPNHRPRQTDAEWRADQAALRRDGTLTSSTGKSDAESVLASLLDKLAPTASAQVRPDLWADDLGYDQLWSESRNFTGSPRNAAVEPMPLGSVLPEGSNFTWEVPIDNLVGRGLALSLTLYYNSRIWSRRNNSMAFDAITGWPAPGYSLGFGRIVAYDLAGSGSSTTCKYMWVEPDGTRRYLGSGLWWDWGGTGPFHSSEGSHIVYYGDAQSGGYLKYKDGTTVTISMVNNRLLPTMILDRNGNHVQVSYKDNPSTYAPMAIDYVTDSLGRVISFQYDANYRLSAIVVPGFGGTAQNPVSQTVAQFDYQTFSPTYGFTGLTVERTPITLMRLKHIYFPATSTGYLPTYSPFGMVSSVSVRRQMNLAVPLNQDPPFINDGIESANISFNYPTSGSLTDAPAFTQRTQAAVNSPTSVYSYTTSTDTGAQAMTFTCTRPDSTQLLLTRSTNSSSPANCRLVQSETKNGAASLSKTVMTYVNDDGGAPQVQSVTSYDDNATSMKVDFDYDSKGNITNKREYGHQVSGAWQVRRRTRMVYTTIGSAVNLVTEVNLYDALLNTSDADDVMIAKSTYAYDNYVAMGGMEEYGGTANPPGHIGWGASYTARGNVTGVTQWTDLGAGTTIQRLAKYDKFGNVVKAQLSCCQERDLTSTDATYWSQPSSEMSGDPNGAHQTTSIDYDFNTSLPVSATDAGGLITNFGYDAALNPTSASLPTGASASEGFDYGNLSSSSSFSYVEGGVTKTISTSKQYDGWGRVTQSVDRNNGQVNTSYDSMGRVISRTNPFTAGGTPGPVTTIQYDLPNKAVITTFPGGNTTRSDYSGNTVTNTDQVNRKVKRETDGLGRLIKVTEQSSSGALTQETSYSYNLLDKILQVNQGGQLRSYNYDALGRLLFERIPEQLATINDSTGTYWTSKYTYTEFGAINTKQDARGVITTYSYDALHRVTGTSYNTSGASGVAATAPVWFVYTAWGALSSVSIANDYTESHTYDDFNRPESVTRWIQPSSINNTYTTSYQYNEGSQLNRLTYPSGNAVNASYDDRGRLQSLPYDPENPSQGVISGVSYNVAGQVTASNLGFYPTSYVTETYSYDANRMQLISQTATKSGGSPNGLMSVTYGYQASAGQMGTGSTAGNAGQLMSISGTINETTESAAYTYDLLGRLVTSNQTSNGSSAQRKFAYDRWGNRTTVWPSLFGGTPIQSVTLQQSGGVPTNQIATVTNSGLTVNYTYDAAGNVTNDGMHTYTYDAENRVVSADNGATAQYTYDYLNQRVSKTVWAAITHYIWDSGRVIAEHDATTPSGPYGSTPYGERSSKIDYVYAGNTMVSSLSYTHNCATHPGGVITCTTSSVRQFYLKDRLSERVVLDSSLSVIARQGHLPFGEDFAQSGTQEKHHFTSYERDSESGTDYAVNRQYSAGVGRFNRPDPKESSARLAGPQSWNRYSYINNEPIDQTDPLGLEPIGGENIPSFARECDPSSGPCPAWIHDCATYSANCGFGTGIGFILDGTGGGINCFYSCGRTPVQVPRRPPPPTCVLTQLPSSGAGYYTYSPRQNQYGRAGLIDQLEIIGYFWMLIAFPVRIGIGDISLRGGGAFPPHSSHRSGLDVDIRPLRNDFAERPVTYHDRAYSRQLTQQLVDLLRVTMGVRNILFNDPQIAGVNPFPGHDNHLHVSFDALVYPCP